MAPKPTAAQQAVLASFRASQSRGQQVLAEGAKEREERLAKTQAGAAKKPAAPRKPRKPRATASAAPSGSGEAPSAPAAAKDSWRSALPAAPALPLGMRQKQVLDFLRAHEAPATEAEIAAATGRTLGSEPDLAAALEANPKVAYDDVAAAYSYRPDANVRDKAQLLDYIRRAGAPVAASEVGDAYRAVGADVAALKAEGLVLGLHSFDPEVGCEVLYPVDTKLAGCEVDNEVAAVWASTELPDEDEEVAAELVKAGIAPAPRRAPRKRMPAERKRKQRKASRLRAVTNVHLMHLLEGEAPAALDTVAAE